VKIVLVISSGLKLFLQRPALCRPVTWKRRAWLLLSAPGWGYRPWVRGPGEAWDSLLLPLSAPNPTFS